MKINIFDGTELVVHVRDSAQEWRNRDLKKKFQRRVDIKSCLYKMEVEQNEEKLVTRKRKMSKGN